MNRTPIERRLVPAPPLPEGATEFPAALIPCTIAKFPGKGPTRRPSRPHSRSFLRPRTDPDAILLACVLTLVLYLGAYMRLPLVPLFARDWGFHRRRRNDQRRLHAGGGRPRPAAGAHVRPSRAQASHPRRDGDLLPDLPLSARARTPLHVGLIYLFSGVGLACSLPR